jgi:hypothetical protein
MAIGTWAAFSEGAAPLKAQTAADQAPPAQSPAAPEWQTAAGGKMAFEVASIKQSKPGTFFPPNFPLDPGDAYASTGGRFSADFGLRVYIQFAYKYLIPEQAQAIQGRLPKWVATDAFDIQARAPIDQGPDAPDDAVSACRPLPVGGSF